MATVLGKALTFDDVLLVPEYSEVTPDMVDVSAWLTPSIKLGVPLHLCRHGYRNGSRNGHFHGPSGRHRHHPQDMDVARQRLEVEKVKKSESGMILDPVTVAPRRHGAARSGPHVRLPRFRPARGEEQRARRHSHQPRRALRHRTADHSRLRSDDPRKPRDRARGHHPRRSKHHLHAHRIEKLLVVG